MLQELAILASSVLLKVALFPAYKSTDFEVHRNWLAITHSLPIKEWYYESTSQWTLDYPPLFAWFEYILSLVASRIDPRMVQISSLDYSSIETIYFQRASVILVDLIWFYAILKWYKRLSATRNKMLFAFLFLNPGLLLVDNIHFQYNGFMYGIQLISVLLLAENHFISASIIFACLLNFKHIYLYQSLAYFIFILRQFVFKGKFSFKRLVSTAISVISVFLAVFLPFKNEIGQIAKRLFPFKRGLTHSYWAPNFWALYSFIDRLLIKLLKVKSTETLTRGIVGDSSFSVLPIVSPSATFAITIISQLPCLYFLWKRPSAYSLLQALIITGFCSFLFGWHVHEKAILMCVIPASIISIKSITLSRLFYVLNTAAVASLLPLIYPIRGFFKLTVETGVKLGIFLISCTANYLFFKKIHKGQFNLNLIEKLYISVVVLIVLSSEIMWPLLVHFNNRFKVGFDSSKFEFLPLMLTSVVCSIGVIYSWIGYYLLMSVNLKVD